METLKNVSDTQYDRKMEIKGLRGANVRIMKVSNVSNMRLAEGSKGANRLVPGEKRDDHVKYKFLYISCFKRLSQKSRNLFSFFYFDERIPKMIMKIF